MKETENKINFLLARYPQAIPRDTSNFFELLPAEVRNGIPSQLLANRPDLKHVPESILTAARLDVQVARAEFYPSLDITAALGLQAFSNHRTSLSYPESILFTMAGDLAAPLINRNAIKAEYYNANARQLQAVFNYERSILNGYLEVSSQLSKIENVQKSYELKAKQVDALNNSINIANDLF